MRGLIVGVLLGLCCFVGTGVATSSARQPDLDEVHRLIQPSSLDILVPVGSQIRVECALPNDAGYLAVGPAIGISMPVLTVTAAQLDTAPRGPFKESCDHWVKRHHVTTIES